MAQAATGNHEATPPCSEWGAVTDIKPLLNLQPSYVGCSSSRNKLLRCCKTPEDAGAGEVLEEGALSRLPSV